jgi:hypothetical protein
MLPRGLPWGRYINCISSAFSLPHTPIPLRYTSIPLPFSMSANLSLFDLNGNLGALEIGSVLGVFLFGIETLQTFNYYRRSPKDSNLLKPAVSRGRGCFKTFSDLPHPGCFRLVIIVWPSNHTFPHTRFREGSGTRTHDIGFTCCEWPSLIKTRER